VRLDGIDELVNGNVVAVARGHEHHGGGDIQCKDNVGGGDRGGGSVFGGRRSGSRFIRLGLR